MTVLHQSNTRAQVQETLDGLELRLNDEPRVVHAYPTMPPAPQPLDCWTQWDHTEWINAWNHRTTWVVLIVLPQGMPADVALDDAIATAVGQELLTKIGGVIQRAEPVGVRLQDATAPTVPAISITFVV
jgi:hypothetical protein